MYEHLLEAVEAMDTVDIPSTARDLSTLEELTKKAAMLETLLTAIGTEMHKLQAELEANLEETKRLIDSSIKGK